MLTPCSRSALTPSCHRHRAIGKAAFADGLADAVRRNPEDLADAEARARFWLVQYEQKG